MASEKFAELTGDFQSLARQLKSCLDPAERKLILAKMKKTIQELERLNSRH
jgi:hypothetical protein